MIIFNSLYYIIQKHDKKEKNVEIDQKLFEKSGRERILHKSAEKVMPITAGEAPDNSKVPRKCHMQTDTGHPLNAVHHWCC